MGVKNTFSSWDSCMSKAYCKWPVIAGIIIGSLIVVSMVYCIVQIICCGAQCCFCFASLGRCLCCGCCRNSGGGRRGDNYDPQMKNNGYVRPSDFNTGYPPQGQYRSQAPPHYGPPATATFESPAKTARYGNEDALPAMPSWSDAQSRRIEDHSHEHEDLEMGKLNNAGQTEPMLPKFESDDFRSANGSSAYGVHNQTGDLGLGAGAGAGAMAAVPYRDNYSRQESYGRSTAATPTSYSRPHQQPYGQAPSTAYGYTRGNNGYAAHNQLHEQEQEHEESPYHNYEHDAAPAAPAPAYGNPPQEEAYHRNHQPQLYASQSSPTYPQPAGYHPDRVQSPGYAPQTSSPQKQSYAAYPGQSTYQSSAPAPSSAGYSSYGGPETTRKPVQGSWRDV